MQHNYTNLFLITPPDGVDGLVLIFGMLLGLLFKPKKTGRRGGIKWQCSANCHLFYSRKYFLGKSVADFR